MSHPPKRHLRIVEDPIQPTVHAREDFEPQHGERTLFATSDPNILVFLDFASIDEAEFLSLLISSKPLHVVDVRVVPRFDVGNLNRKLVFSVFKNAGATYHDLGATVGAAHLRALSEKPSDVARAVLDRVLKNPRPLSGPIVVIVDTRQIVPDFVDEFAKAMDSANPSGWQTLRLPALNNAKGLGNRTVVFISHATPDDNSFAQWLSTQLALSGYEVWTDFERLEGGELFWDTIEDVIRNRAAKVVVAASALAQTRSGVLDEVALALSVERSLGLAQFVIPLRIDETPFNEFRANIARKNIVNFHGNWASGLTQLLQVLENDRVPVEPREAVNHIGKLVHDRLQTKRGLKNTPDPVLVNWVQVKSWPSAIHALSLPVPSIQAGAHARTVDVPNVAFNDVFISFANAQLFSTALRGLNASSAGSITTNEFLSGRWKQYPSIAPHIARRIASNLLRQAWERTARRKGLIPFALASKAYCWFLPKDKIDGNKAYFRDQGGKRRFKALVGFSPKRGVYWHFAGELRALPNHPETLVLKPHVIFSEDGITPLESAARMHALRRGFCKSWWNDRWRDLIVAYLSFLSDENAEFALDAGGVDIMVSGLLTGLECPVSPDESEAVSLADELAADEDDEDPEIDDDELGFSVWPSTPSEQS